MALAHARLETVTRTGIVSLSDKLGYLIRSGRHAAKHDLVGQPVTRVPIETPKSFHEANRLWSEADRFEKRCDAVVAVEIVAALPVNLSDSLCLQLMHSFVDMLVAQFRIGATAVMHRGHELDGAVDGSEAGPDTTDDASPEQHNKHIHVLITSRILNAAGFADRRHPFLLPALKGGRVVDAVPVARLWEECQHAFFAAQGLLLRCRLPAPQPSQHIGPVRALGALLGDVLAIARRPNARDNLAKLDRLQVNKQIEHRNRAAVRAIDPMLAALGDRVFQLSELQHLIARFIADGDERNTILGLALSKCRELADPQTGGAAGRYVTTASCVRGQHLDALLTSFPTNSATEACIERKAVSSAIASSSGAVVLDIDATADNTGVLLHDVIADLERTGQKPVLVTHRAQARELPMTATVRPFGWKGFSIAADETIFVDEADALSLTDLLHLVQLCSARRAQLVLIRRPERLGWPRVDVMDRVAAALPNISVTGPAAAAAPGRDMDAKISALATLEALTAQRRLSWVETADGLVERALNEARRARLLAQRSFILVTNRELTTALRLAASADRRVLIGDRVPEHFSGTVIAVLGPVDEQAVPLLPQLAGRKFRTFAATSLSTDLQMLAQQQNLIAGRLSSLHSQWRSVPALVPTPSDARSTSTVYAHDHALERHSDFNNEDWLKLDWDDAADHADAIDAQDRQPDDLDSTLDHDHDWDDDPDPDWGSDPGPDPDNPDPH